MYQETKPGERHPDLGEPTSLPFETLPPVPPTPAPKKLEDAERLQIENLYLQMQLMQQQVENIDLRKAQVVDQMRNVQTQMENLRAELSKKYGTPIERATVKPDGTIMMPGATR